ncbi:MAG: 2TM domain-containing protein [Flavobacterium sp.]|nr:2TM domain-containing protein [Flavobacterium sp.]
MEITNETERAAYIRAKKKVKEIRSFYYNLTFYCIVIPILIFINLYYVPEQIWFFWPMLGWGIGLMFHGFEAFSYNPFLGKDWERRKIDELVEKEKRNSNSQRYL